MKCITNTPLCVIQGDDEVFNLTFTLDGTTPLNLTGSQITFVVVPSAVDPVANALITKTATIVSAVAGTAQLDLSNTDTDKPVGEYSYRMKMTNAGKVKTIMKGTFSIEWAK